MKKKLLAVMLAAALSVTMFACGSSDTDTASEETSADASAEAESTDTSDSGEDSGSSEEIAFESQTIMDNDEVSAVITGIETDDIWGYFTLNLELENKSDAATYTFSVLYASVNGVMSDPYFAADVSAGNKAIESINFDAATLEEYGIDTFTDIVLDIAVYDADTWEDLAEETVHVYPYGEESASAFERSSEDTDTVALDDDYAAVIVTGYEMDELWDYTVCAYMVNKTDSLVMFSIDEASVNGYMCDPYWADEVFPGSAAFERIYWDETSLEEIGITDPENEIESIEFELTVYDYDTFDTYTQQTVTLNP